MKSNAPSNFVNISSPLLSNTGTRKYFIWFDFSKKLGTPTGSSLFLQLTKMNDGSYDRFGVQFTTWVILADCKKAILAASERPPKYK